jgi:hypothetical protein
VRYFPRQLITAEDMRAEQDWVRDRLRRHTRLLHGWGVVCGLTVVAPAENEPRRQVTVCPGYAASPQGDEIYVNEPVTLDLLSGATTPEPCGDQWPCPPRGAMPGNGTRTVHIAIRYAECLSRPVRVHPAGCGCDGVGCEHSRIRESFELKVLWELPESHTTAREADAKWRALVQAQVGGGHGEAPRAVPSPACPACTDDPWVVLADVTLPGDATTAISTADITYVNRRALWSVSALQAAAGF